ncbi:neuromedin-S [Tachyglossus aculeatus]|uniref:neuromedin-S n=1 Tax=Tachyglossus aculeatus TaxID=9261 RepID=UPI0018F38699|nr:neuromedin-S [Tachyglossus aculeatus]
MVRPASPAPGLVALFCLWTLWAAAVAAASSPGSIRCAAPLLGHLLCAKSVLSVETGFPPPRPRSLDDLDVAELEIAPGDPLMRLAAKLSERRMQRFFSQDPQIAPVVFVKKNSPGSTGQSFFLFRPRNGRNIEDGQ